MRITTLNNGGVLVAPIKESDKMHTKKFTATHVEGEFKLPITHHMLGVFIQWQLENSDTEIAGFFSIEDGILRWGVKCSNDNNGAHVTMSHSQQVESMELLDQENRQRAELNELKGTNYAKLKFDGQWHTHPGFSAYWSGTDISDQEETIYDQVDFNPQGGSTMFMVYNLTDMRLRKWWWNLGTDGKPEIFYQDGVVVIGSNKQELDLSTSYSGGISDYVTSYKYVDDGIPWYNDGDFGFSRNKKYEYENKNVEIIDLNADYGDTHYCAECLVHFYDCSDWTSFEDAIESLDYLEFSETVELLHHSDRKDVADLATVCRDSWEDLVEDSYTEYDPQTQFNDDIQDGLVKKIEDLGFTNPQDLIQHLGVESLQNLLSQREKEMQNNNDSAIDIGTGEPF